MPSTSWTMSKKNSASNKLTNGQINCKIVNRQIVNMADGYLESHYAEYEKPKAEWLKKKKKWSNNTSNNKSTGSNP